MWDRNAVLDFCFLRSLLSYQTFLMLASTISPRTHYWTHSVRHLPLLHLRLVFFCLLMLMIMSLHLGVPC